MQGEASRGVWGWKERKEARLSRDTLARQGFRVFRRLGRGSPVYSVHLWRQHDYIVFYTRRTLNYGDRCFELLCGNALISLIPLLGNTCVNMSYIAIADLKNPTALTPI